MEGGVFDGTSGLGGDLDQVEVDVLPLEIGNSEHGLNRDLGQLALALGNNLGSERGHGSLDQVFVVVRLNIQLLGNLVQSLTCEITSNFEPGGDLEGVEVTVNELEGLDYKASGQHDHTGSTVTDLIILTLGKLDEESGDGVLDLHLLDNGGSVVSDQDLSVGSLDHLVHTLGS